MDPWKKSVLRVCDDLWALRVPELSETNWQVYQSFSDRLRGLREKLNTLLPEVDDQFIVAGLQGVLYSVQGYGFHSACASAQTLVAIVQSGLDMNTGSLAEYVKLTRSNLIQSIDQTALRLKAVVLSS